MSATTHAAHESPPTNGAMASWNLLFAAWLIAAVSTAGSFFFSHVMEFPPCALCWYQRICLFPLVIILGRALFPLDLSGAKYALPLALLGWAIAVWHNLLYIGMIPASLTPCSQGVSCTESYLEFGFVSIPLLALLSFTALVGVLIVLNRRSNS